MVKVVIDGREVDVPRGTVLVDAAKQVGIEIPVFCYHEKMKPVAACRMCLIEIEKMRGLQPGCAITAAEGMVVHTNTPAVVAQQKALLEFLLINHPLDCPVCDKGGECPLQDNTFKYGPGNSRYIEPKRHFVKPLQLSEKIFLDRERCILCYRCVRFHSDIAQDNALGMIKRGAESEIGVAPGHTLDSPFQGNIIEICPVGALTSSLYRFTARPWDIQNVPTVCAQCAVGCNISLTVRENAVKRVLARRNDPVDDGWICDTGRFTYEFVNSPERLTTPLVRKDGEFVAVGWTEALTTIASKFQAIKDEHGAIAGLVSPTLTNEELYLFQKFFRTVIGTNSIDYRSAGQADTDAVLQAEFGQRAGTGSIQGLEQAKTIVLIGANPLLEQPILDLRIRKAAGNGVGLITVNASRRPLDDVASQVLRATPGSEPAVVRGILAAMFDSGKVSPDAERRFPGLSKRVRDAVGGTTPADAAQAAGVSEDSIKSAATRLLDHGPSAILYSESWADGAGNDAVTLLALLAKLSGSIGVVGGALNRLPLYANTQGAIDMGALPHLLPGHQLASSSAVQASIKEAWRADLPATTGLDVAGIVSAASGGKLQALYISGQDPASKWGPEVRNALADVPFLVVQDAFLTETARGADVVLPAVTFAEENGTLTSLERRIQRLRPSIQQAGDSLPGWQIISDLANRMGGRFFYGSAAEVMVEIAAVVPQYAGVTYGRIGAKGIQWPVPSRQSPGTAFMYVDPQPEAAPQPAPAAS
jgi:NADH-quinone oxidoreductase chain G